MEKVIGSNLSKKIKTITSKNKQHFIYNQSRDELIKLLKLSEKFLKEKLKISKITNKKFFLLFLRKFL